MTRIETHPSRMDESAKESVREHRDPGFSGYEWGFDCDCGAVHGLDQRVESGDVIVCGDCGSEYEITVEER